MRHTIQTLAMAVLCLFAGSAYGVTVRVLDPYQQGLAEAVVSFSNSTPVSASPDTRVIIDQINRAFVPRVSAVQVGTLVQFPNSDDVRHHVYSFSAAKRFELKLYHGHSAPPIHFNAPGKVVLGCNIHDAMVGYVYVMATPYFALTDPRGWADISLPAGD
jgi:plastocyanin